MPALGPKAPPRSPNMRESVRRRARSSFVRLRATCGPARGNTLRRKMSWLRRPLWSGRMSRYRLNTGQVVGANPASLSSSVRNGVAVAIVVFRIPQLSQAVCPGADGNKSSTRTPYGGVDARRRRSRSARHSPASVGKSCARITSSFRGIQFPKCRIQTGRDGFGLSFRSRARR